MEKLRGALAWASVGLLALSCGVLAVLQYQWIGEITEAERGRLRETLRLRVNSLSRAFNDEISNASAALIPPEAQVEQLGRERAYAAQYLQSKASTERFFRRIALAVPRDGAVDLLNLDLNTARFSPADWPSEWSALHERMIGRLEGGPPRTSAGQPSALFEIPRFGPGPGPGEREWLVLELNVEYVRSSLLPEMLSRYLGEGGRLDYDAEVVDNANPSMLMYESTPGHAHSMEGNADASVALLEMRPNGFQGRGGRGPGPGRRFGGPPWGPPPNQGRAGPRPEGPMPGGGGGRWQLLVRHRAGSLEALVTRTRTRNLAISGGLLLLILATVALLVRFSRKAHQLAELQMNFVAGVSHELRTPVTVIRTAAFNLRGKLASQPEHVARYGALIQAEAEKLTALIDQVLRFASTTAGHAIREREPVEVESLIDEQLQFSQAALNGQRLEVERKIDRNLPPLLADRMALRQALQNLVDNALKYGAEGSNWIGVFASAVTDSRGEQAVEIRIADHGPGIPADEQARVFDPFFRGRRAVKDQVHGTGLGLSLVKKIVEAHGGTIRVRSEPIQGTEFIIRIPASSNGAAG